MRISVGISDVIIVLPETGPWWEGSAPRSTGCRRGWRRFATITPPSHYSARWGGRRPENELRPKSDYFPNLKTISWEGTDRDGRDGRNLQDERRSHDASTFNIDRGVSECVLELTDNILLAKWSVSDLTSQEAVYYVKCLATLHSEASRLMSKSVEGFTVQRLLSWLYL